ncbi:hypothetical protein [Arthrobacter woluwensis]|uniref:hypothetical protein n=1 Tax=Arthrobacter woluwensis TaxID=156980 RepID=UPI000D121FED|nr:hypothetical protein [Arthrobacter woluwensis]PSS45061.1 hypothetical protein C6401_02790 [Arthrobacter woluwensis]QTF71314.1 hypothetical protein G8758_04300 [Arthrobacter woluwensis]
MIPDNWFPATRPDDGETVGYLDMVGEEFQPYDLLGRPHGEPAEYTEAEERLAELGLSYLARRWSFAVQDHPEPIAVVISELNRDAVVVLSDDADYHRDFGTPFSVPLPLDGSVLWENPDGSGPRFTQSVPNR